MLRWWGTWVSGTLREELPWDRILQGPLQCNLQDMGQCTVRRRHRDTNQEESACPPGFVCFEERQGSPWWRKQLLSWPLQRISEMKINLSEFWAKERKNEGKWSKMYKEQLIIFLSKYCLGNEDEKGGRCSKTVGNERSTKILVQKPQLK